MKNICIIFTLTLTLFLSACAGKLYTHTDIKKQCGASCNGSYEGVFVRPLVPYRITFDQDRILDGEGKLTHFSGGSEGKNCEPIRYTEIKLIPDPLNQNLVQYDSAIFESSTFSVKLTEAGTLSEVGTSSTPGGKALSESLIGLATTIKILNHGHDATKSGNKLKPLPIPSCSHGRKVYDHVRLKPDDIEQLLTI